MSRTNDTEPREEKLPDEEQTPEEGNPEEEIPAAEAPEENGEASEESEETEEADGCQKELEAAKTELAAEKDKYLRLLAEYDNYRKRSARERDNLYADIKADVIVKLLPVYDNLERALGAATEDEAYRKGVEMIMNQFCATLEKLGVTPIECLGEKFDPALHNAVMHVDDGEKGENEIVEVFQKGFQLGDKVIRFAMVKVAN